MELWIRKHVIILNCCKNCYSRYKLRHWIRCSKIVSLLMSPWLTQWKASDAGRFEGRWECGLMLAHFTHWADRACVIALSANAWMLAFSVLNILLTLLSNFSSFSTFWEHALHTLLEGRHSSAASNTLKSSLNRTSTNGEVFRCQRLCESLTELLQKRTLICCVGTYHPLSLDHVRNFDNFSKFGLTVMSP